MRISRQELVLTLPAHVSLYFRELFMELDVLIKYGIFLAYEMKWRSLCNLKNVYKHSHI